MRKPKLYMELDITGDLTVDEIHKIREYNYNITKDMTRQERYSYYEKESAEFRKKLKDRKQS